MNKSILVLDENSVIHGLVTSALETEGLTLHHEFNPGRYVERASSLMPDLILLGNSERDPGYEIVRRIKAGELADVPMVLLASSRESLNREQLRHLRVDGVVRKPFEASDLQQQVSKHLNLVELIGSAYEYRQSQSTAEEGANPLANLNVLDDEVLGLLRGTASLGGATEGEAGSPPVPGAPVVDDEVLAETLQPERAFERIDEPPAGAGARFDSLETLEGEFPSQTLEMPESEAEFEELGAGDVLEEEAPEESVLAPQGFDQDLDGGPRLEPGAPLDEIEVELGEDLAGLRDSAPELEESGVDLFESDLETMEPQAAQEFEESIPLSVRRMMELKPVFTMTQEETAADEDVLEPFDFEPDAAEVEAIQQDLDELGEVALEVEEEEEAEPEPVQEQELEFVSPLEAKALEDDLEPPEDFDLMQEEREAPSAAAPEEAPPLTAEEEPAPREEVPLEFDELEAGEVGEELEEELTTGLEAGPAAAPEEAPPVQATAAPAEPAADEDYFVDEYLGDEEIDEDQIIAADEEEIEEQPELSPEDEAELDELLAEDEHLGDLEDFEDLDADELVDAEAAEEEVELEEEEEDLILSSLEAERGEAELGAQAGAGEPLFERNFKSLAEEPTAAGEDETWQLEQEEGGFAIADQESEPAGEAAEVIHLHTPEPEEAPELEAMEEVPASALEEIEEEIEEQPEEVLEAVPLEEDTDAGPVSIEFGEGEGEVFDDESEPWRPKTPPSFVAQPAEDFPEDAVREPFTGPESEREEGAPVSPRHLPEEVLEDPDSLAPVVERVEASEGGAQPSAEDLADSVHAHELDEDFGAGEEAEEDFAAAPSLSALADHALGSVEEPLAAEEPVDEQMLDAELGPEEPAAWEEEEMSDAFEPVDLEAETLEPSAAVTRGEMDALMSEEAAAAEEEEDLETLLGGGGEAVEAEPLAEEFAAAGTGDSEFDDLFSSLREEIAANPEGERLDDVLRKEQIRDQAAALEFSLPQNEDSFARALGVYELPGDGEGASAFPAAFDGGGAERPAAPAAAARAPEPPPLPHPALGASAADASALSLLDPDIRAKLGQVLDEIISISVRKAVQEEMPKIMERMSRNP